MALSDEVWPDRPPAVDVRIARPTDQRFDVSFADPDIWRIVLMPKPIPLTA